MPLGFPAIRSSRAGAATSGYGSVYCTMPASVQSGDSLLVVASIDANTGGSLSAASGWTMLCTLNVGAATKGGIFFKKAAGTESGQYLVVATCSISDGNGSYAAYSIYDAADPTVTPPEDGSASSGSTPTITFQAVEPAAGSGNYLIIACEADTYALPLVAWPAGYTLSRENYGNSPSGVHVAVSATTVTSDSETPGNMTLTGSSDQWASVAVAVYPDPTSWLFLPPLWPVTMYEPTVEYAAMWVTVPLLAPVSLMSPDMAVESVRRTVDGDTSKGGWETSPTPGQALYLQLDENPESDVDYIYDGVA